MQDIFKEIRALEHVNSFSKNEQLVQGIINAIDQKILKSGDLLPSVNQMINELGFARETIVRAYKDLIGKGLIESKNRRGYFVANVDTDQHLKVVILLYAFDTFQETLYKNFREHLGENVQLDVFFHHNNLEIFETIINRVKGQYGMYVVAPVSSPEAVAILKKLPLNKFLMIDRFVDLGEDHSYIVQEFEDSSFRAFFQLTERIREFEEFVFFFKPSSAEPDEILRSFKKFIKVSGVKGKILDHYKSGSIEAGKVYFTIHNLELWEMLKDSKNKGLKLGTDTGILTHNDDNVKEIIFDGITTFSIDFAEMGKKAAEFVLKREPVKEVMENVLIRRNSL